MDLLPNLHGTVAVQLDMNRVLDPPRQVKAHMHNRRVLTIVRKPPPNLFLVNTDLERPQLRHPGQQLERLADCSGIEMFGSVVERDVANVVAEPCRQREQSPAQMRRLAPGRS